jgi:hypothetical protein
LICSGRIGCGEHTDGKVTPCVDRGISARIDRGPVDGDVSTRIHAERVGGIDTGCCTQIGTVHGAVAKRSGDKLAGKCVANVTPGGQADIRTADVAGQVEDVVAGYQRIAATAADRPAPIGNVVRH